MCVGHQHCKTHGISGRERVERCLPLQMSISTAPTGETCALALCKVVSGVVVVNCVLCCPILKIWTLKRSQELLAHFLNMF